MAASDLALLAKWSSEGDAEAFKELASRHAAMVYATCKRILGSAAEAEDVAQECFELLSQRPEAPKKNLAAWLHAVATTKALNTIKAGKRRDNRERNFAAHRQISEETEAIEWDDVYAYVDDAVAGLPEKLRQPIVLHFFEDQTHDAIAEATGVARATITYRIQRGIEGIRKSLRRQGVIVSIPAMGALMASNLVAEAAPATLAAGIAKLALAGNGVVSAGLSAGPAVSIGGILLMKKAMIGVGAALVLGAFAFLFVEAPFRAGTLPQPAPKLSPGPVSVEEEERGSDDAETPFSQALFREETPLVAGTRVIPETMPASEPVESGGEGEGEPGRIKDPSQYASVSGMVLLSQGGAVPYAKVALCATGYGSPSQGYLRDENFESTFISPDHHFQTTADGDGRYTIEAIPYSGYATLRASAEGHSGGTSVYLSPGDEPVTADVFITEGVVLVGRVLSPAGMPIPGAVANVNSFMGRTRLGLSHQTTVTGNFVYTDSDGVFSLGFAEEGVAILDVLAAGHPTATFADILVGASEIAELRLKNPAALEGRITWHDGSPGEGLLVSLQQMFVRNIDGQSHFQRGSTHRAYADRNGYYTFEEIAAGFGYYVEVREEGDRRLSQGENLAEFAAGETRIWDHVVQAETIVEGHVRGAETGQPLENVHIWIRSRGTNAGGFADTGADGAYRLSIPSGAGVFEISAHHLMVSTLLSESRGREVRLDLGQTHEFDLTLPEPFTATLRVVDESGAPVDGTSIDVLVHSTPDWTTIIRVPIFGHTDEDGLFSFANGEPGAEHYFRVSKPGYAGIESAHYTGESGQVFPEETLTLYRASGVEGIVLRDDGTPLANESLWLNVSYGEDQTIALSALTDSRGAFTILDAVPATTVTLNLSHSTDDLDGHEHLTASTGPIECVESTIANLGEIVLSPEHE